MNIHICLQCGIAIVASMLLLGACAAPQQVAEQGGALPAETDSQAQVQNRVAEVSSTEFPLYANDTVRAGETLWRFAERTTGSGFNWKKIAELNGIDDSRTLKPGTVLSIPPELVADGAAR